MNEYKVTFRATIPGFLSSRTATEIKVYEAMNGDEAIRKAKDHLERELEKNDLDPEVDDFTVEIIDIRKL